MELNLNYYKQDVFYNVTKNEEKIIKYIKENQVEEYEKIIKEDNSDEVILAFSTLRNNIVYFYDFNENSSVLEIGAHLGEVTNLLCKKARNVIAIETVKSRAEAIKNRCRKRDNLEIIVGNLKDISFDEKFDYITLFGILEYSQLFFDSNNPAEELIKYCKGFLKEDGKLLIATNNKFSMKSYVGVQDECTSNNFDSITGYKNSKKTFKLGKNSIEKILNNNGFIYYNFFYPLPDFKLANTIFSDNYLPSSSKINAYIPYYMDENNVLFSEVDAFDAIVKEDKNMFKFFANSYFIETSIKELKNDIRYVGFNNYRKKKYRLMTKIKESCVEKKPTEPDSREHIRQMNSIICKIKEEGINILDSFENDKITSKFVNEKLVSQLISDNLEDKDYIIKLFKKYKNDLLKLSHSFKNNEITVFNKYNLDLSEEVIQKFNYLENGYWDMIFKNCFYINNQFVFFDQEWIERNIPVEFLVYRCIVNIEKLRDKIEKYNLFEELEIKEYIEIFKKLDNEIFNEVFDENVFNLFMRKHKNPIYECETLKDELIKEKNTIMELEKSIQNLSNEIFDKNDQIKKLTEFKNEVENIKGFKTFIKFRRKIKK